ncbi:MAG: tRNA pseudouridine(38-40) synthase TruA [Thermoanaerobaculia bacterium]
MKILCFTSYLGTYFNGWQRQKKERSVQGTIENALQKIYKKKVNILGAGRTDAGVHAENQAFHFIPPFKIEKENLKMALNSTLPWDVKINKIFEVRDSFSARRDVQSKVYLYRLKIGNFLSPLEYLFYGSIKYELDIEKMKQALKFFEGERDFYKFTVLPHIYKDTKRKILKTKFISRGEKIHIYIEGNGFLRYQIRRIVGTLIEIGRGKRDMNWLLSLFDRNSSEKAGPPVEAKGLVLLKVKYPKKFLYGNN